MTKYQDLSAERKKAISEVSKAYNKLHYKQLKVSLHPSEIDRFDKLCQKHNLSKAGMVRNMIFVLENAKAEE